MNPDLDLNFTVAFRKAGNPSGLTSKKSLSSKFPDGFAEVHPVILRPTKASPATALAQVGEMSMGAHWSWAWRVPQAPYLRVPLIACRLGLAHASECIFF